VRVAAIVLAAGAGTRMGGRPKALLTVDQQTFIARVVDTARRAGVSRLVVVLGHAADEVERALGDAADVTVALNPEPARGQLSSLKVGLREAAECDGALAWPVDHPLVRTATVTQVLAEAARHPGKAVVPRFEGRGGHPTFFPRTLFSALMSLPDEAGARGLFERHPEAVLRIDVEDPGVRHDIDTPADYAKI
jgi:molybdenum cofactor cytidylyltransferase